jgi:16S rRNA (cytosine1402-N4)-methyltransferase
MSSPASDPYHVPVLADEVVRQLVTDRGGCYLDLTVGGGYHLAAVAKVVEPGARLYGVDRDPNAIAHARTVLQHFPVVQRIARASFGDLVTIARELGITGCHGILLDLGISWRQVDDPSRGFSFRHDGPLDMRMDPNLPTSAADLVNALSQQELTAILREFGEERQAARLARAIVTERQTGMIRTTSKLATIVAQVVRGPHQAKSMARVFQAFRIAVNREMDELRSVLPAALSLLYPGGRLAVIAYHSLEDRTVKRFFREQAKSGSTHPAEPVRQAALRILTRKPIVPEEAETDRNPRARSARLRVAEKV